jgi:hypothetical protein
LTFTKCCANLAAGLIVGKRLEISMLWMERFAIIFYFAINIFIYGLDWLLASSMSENMTLAEIKEIFTLCVILTLIAWASFRAIDFLFAGPLRREIKRGQELIERSRFR